MTSSLTSTGGMSTITVQDWKSVRIACSMARMPADVIHSEEPVTGCSVGSTAMRLPAMRAEIRASCRRVEPSTTLSTPVLQVSPRQAGHLRLLQIEVNEQHGAIGLTRDREREIDRGQRLAAARRRRGDREHLPVTRIHCTQDLRAQDVEGLRAGIVHVMGDDPARFEVPRIECELADAMAI